MGISHHFFSFRINTRNSLNVSHIDLKKRAPKAPALANKIETRCLVSGTVLPMEMQRRALRRFVGARLVGRRVRGAIIRSHQPVGQEVRFDFFSANVG